MAGQAISVDTADQMITAYMDYMSNLGVNMEEQTQRVSFSIGPLITWLNSIAADSDSISVCMAAYPEGEPSAGRTSVILWPYKNGEPAERGGEIIEPYNDGSLDP